MKKSMILARDRDGVIGIDNQLPWHCPADLKLFKDLTLNKIIVMGRGTWDSLPFKPLKNRINIVITSDVQNVKGEPHAIVNSVERAIEVASELFNTHSDELVFIGGASIYNQVIGLVDEAHISEFGFSSGADKPSELERTVFDYDFIDDDWTTSVNCPVYESDTGKQLFDYFHFVRRLKS